MVGRRFWTRYIRATIIGWAQKAHHPTLRSAPRRKRTGRGCELPYRFAGSAWRRRKFVPCVPVRSADICWSGAYLCPRLLALAGATKFLPVRLTRGGSNKYTSMYYLNQVFVRRTSFPSEVFILADGLHGFWTRYQMPG